MAGWPQRNRQKDQGDDPALIELKKKDAAQKKQDEDEIAAGTYQISCSIYCSLGKNVETQQE